MTLQDPPSTIPQRLARVRAEIEAAAVDCDRPPAAVTLVAVSKTIPADAIEEALGCGQRAFGENYVQESQAKWPALRERWPDVELHLVGPLQSNKARDAVALFDVIHSVDRPSLAAALAREIERSGRRPRLLVQVNTGEEPQKSGVLPAGLDDFLVACRDRWHLPVEGLMCIPPDGEMPSPHFAMLQAAARRHRLETLSMGMSADFPAAIQLGATHVRIGTAIFGHRSRPA